MKGDVLNVSAAFFNNKLVSFGNNEIVGPRMNIPDKYTLFCDGLLLLLEIQFYFEWIKYNTMIFTPNTNY